MASIRTSPGGPLLRSRTRPLNVTRNDCYQVVMRSLAHRQGQWEAISRCGFVVVSPSYLEACNLVWMVGARHFPRPAELIHNDDHDEERYLGWLLRNYFRIEPLESCRVGTFDERGVCRRPPQMLLWAFLRGWYPDAEDLLETATLAADVIAPALRHRWGNR